MMKSSHQDTKPKADQETKEELFQEKDLLTDEEADKISGGIISPRDLASGMPTGKRSHKPLL